MDISLANRYNFIYKLFFKGCFIIINKKKIIILFLLFFCFFLGIEFESGQLINSSFLSYQLVDSLLLLSMPIIYCFFVFLFIRFLNKSWDNLESFKIYIILIISIFAIGWMVAFFNEWSEELIRNNIRNFTGEYLIAFTISEDINYIFMVESVEESLALALTRLAGLPTSHWVYTGIGAYGLLLVKDYKEYLNGFLYMAFIVIIHTLWNSPLNSGVIVSSLLSAITLMVFIYILFKTSKYSFKAYI